MAAASAYPQYRPLRSRWIPRVPEHWSLLRAKNFLREVDDRSKTGEETLLSMRMQRGLVPHNDVSAKRITPENLIGYKKVQPDELVLNRMQAGNAMFFRASQPGLVSPDYAVFRLLRDDNPEYLGYLFRSWPMRGLFRSESKGLGTGTSGFLRLYSDRFAALEIPVPPRAEQDQIVAYLRAQDAHIARFIKAKRELIKLLTEQKLRIIDHAVTRGLDPNVRLKPTGIEWLGEVPDHWETIHVGSAVKVINGYPFDSSHFDTDVGHPLVRIRDLTSMHTEVRYNGPEVVEAVIDTGDLLVGMDGDFNAAMWRGGRALLNQRMCCLRPRKQITTEYLALVIPKALKFINDLTLSTTVKHLSSSDVKRLRFPVPGEAEQCRIVEWVAKESAPLDDAITRAEEEIRLIREYRDRLIADVVTGQIDVRGWRPGPDDVVSDEDLAALGDDETDLREEEPGDGGE
ncbi:restriction endonuclease subunit S [Sulfurivermis fontis]|uniref:restriction endonuclease subunit S n=1 Tax=Sulfurivermis fontis TaxID=1972068 RepID=UPI000FDC983D|nr:restriction endonuclease subunit S [Sulfurivermis fontis]